jgi:protein-S-isoprenylcysteine O-methyltransferase Ste14
LTPLLDHDTAARSVFYVVLGLWVLSEWSISLRSYANRRGSRLRRRSLLPVVVFVYAGLFAGFAWAARVRAATIGEGRWPLFVAGLVLMGAGIAVRQWAVAVLGRSFTIDVRVRAGQTVVDNGPYRWVRHPSYTGLIATFVGIGLALGNWAALAALAILPTVGLLIRIHDEERVLLGELGEPYRRFASDRARLFPGVW